MKLRAPLVTVAVLAAGAAVVAVGRCGLESPAEPQVTLPGSKRGPVGTALSSPSPQAMPVADATDAGAAAERTNQRGRLLDELFAGDGPLELPPEVQRWLRGFVSPSQGRALLRRNAELAKLSVDRYCDEARKLGAGPFGPVSRNRDAAAFLEPRLDWENGQRGTLLLPENLRTRLQSQTWLTAVTEEDLASLDFGWMRELRQFDHWSLASNGPFASSTGFFDAPFPIYLPLLHWSKLRLAGGLMHGDVREAAADVHHLAGLVHSSDTILSESISLMLVRFERMAWEAAREKGLETGDWAPPEVSALDARRRLSVSGSGFVWPMVEDEVVRKALACAPAPCAALVEGRAMGRAAAGVVASSPPEDLERGGCDAALLAHTERVTPADPVDFVDAMGGTSLLERWATVDAGAR